MILFARKVSFNESPVTNTNLTPISSFSPLLPIT
jgi:nucleolin